MLTAETLKFLDDLRADIANLGINADIVYAKIDEYYLQHQYPDNSYHLDNWNPDMVEFLPTTGPRGPYTLATPQDSRDFRLMRRDINACGGKLERDGYFYWTFDNGKKVGRKRIT